MLQYPAPGYPHVHLELATAAFTATGDTGLAATSFTLLQLAQKNRQHQQAVSASVIRVAGTAHQL